MKKLFFLVVLVSITLLASVNSQAQQKLYNPSADAKQDLEKAIQRAKAENKHVFIQVGGNWCVWCLRFNELVTTNKSLDSLMNENYIVVHLNYSKENKNMAVLKQLEFPQRFGFPVFVILDQNGKRLHTQSSAYLESVKGHDTEKVSDFLKSWTPAALDPKNYED